MDRLTDKIRTAIKQAGDRVVVRVTADKLRRILDRTRMAPTRPGGPARRRLSRRWQEASGIARPAPSPCA